VAQIIFLARQNSLLDALYFEKLVCFKSLNHPRQKVMQFAEFYSVADICLNKFKTEFYLLLEEIGAFVLTVLQLLLNMAECEVIFTLLVFFFANG
jgi:hypothetical protein